VLLYFRFRETHYALSRMTLLTLDTVTLIKSALDDRRHGSLKESAAVEQVWRASMHLLTVLSVSFLPDGMPDHADGPDEPTRQRWRSRYHAALRRLQQAGIRTAPDEQRGAENYIALRARWDRYIGAFAHYMVHDMQNIDPAGSRPHVTDERQDFQTRLRSAG
jgi:hypothetical protein